LDEDALAAIVRADAPISGFGIGTSLTTSSDIPALDCAYKLQEYAGLARRKRSTGKATWPGRKQVWRSYDGYGHMTGDVLSLEDDRQEGDPLLVPVVRDGQRLAPVPSLGEIRARAADELSRLPLPLAGLDAEAFYPVRVTPALEGLAAEVDRRTR
jgi:nicotinate phosphoribosyltransferase